MFPSLDQPAGLEGVYPLAQLRPRSAESTAKGRAGRTGSKTGSEVLKDILGGGAGGLTRLTLEGTAPLGASTSCPPALACRAASPAILPLLSVPQPHWSPCWSSDAQASPASRPRCYFFSSLLGPLCPQIFPGKLPPLQVFLNPIVIRCVLTTLFNTYLIHTHSLFTLLSLFFLKHLPLCKNYHIYLLL